MVPAPSATATGITDDLLECNICTDVVYRPITLPCCGVTLCEHCARAHLAKQMTQAGVCLCPGGCNTKISPRLPAVSKMMQSIVEEVMSEEDLQRRREEAEEGNEPLPEGFLPWQEVAANKDLMSGDSMLAAFGTPGVIVGAAADNRIRVKFDERLDSSDLCVDVLPGELRVQLPPSCGVRIGQRVVATGDLQAGERMLVRFSTKGTAMAVAHEGRILVAFDEGADGNGAQRINVLPQEIAACRKLAGGFEVGDPVRSKQELRAGDRLLVKAGTSGVVVNEYSASRVSVRFDELEEGVEGLINVSPGEIERATS
mmetsp:Transcript_43190/g.99572  ORF Transcript_43190/g.99572 Transcript_43190/m.99572 type:complete len:314 (-) Transcript_43190:29-970(-)